VQAQGGRPRQLRRAGCRCGADMYRKRR
jgi:hypothetical protein